MSLARPELVVLITGANRGLGLALVNAFAESGWRVAVGHRSSPPQTSDSVHPVLLDVTDRDSVHGAVTAILDKWGRVDALINNAGIARDNLIPRLEEEDWEEVLKVNLNGAFTCCQAVSETMIRQREGHIINISSWSGRVGAVGQANYAAAKAGLLGLTASLARELGSSNIRVNAVLPGVLPTDMTSQLSAGQMETYASANALGRINSVDEVARFIVFLASLQNVSGQVFQLDSRIGSWS